MSRTEIIIGIVAFLLIAGAIGWVGYGRWQEWRENTGEQSGGTEEGQINTRSGSDELVEEQADEVAAVVEDFINKYRQALREGDESAAQAARELLSERGKTVVDRDATVAVGLQRLTRNLSVPEEVVVEQSRQQSQGFAEVATMWQYPDETLNRYFYMIIEEGEWKIDSIQEIQQ